MDPSIYRIDYEVPKIKNNLKNKKNFKNIFKKTGILLFANCASKKTRITVFFSNFRELKKQGFHFFYKLRKQKTKILFFFFFNFRKIKKTRILFFANFES